MVREKNQINHRSTTEEVIMNTEDAEDITDEDQEADIMDEEQAEDIPQKEDMNEVDTVETMATHMVVGITEEDKVIKDKEDTKTNQRRYEPPRG
jgi:hypothetical protein